MFRIIGWVKCLCERIVYGPEDSDAELVQAIDKERLNQELANVEWILGYEKYLTKLQQQISVQRSQAEELGANTECLRKLEHHLAELCRNIPPL